MNVLQLSFDNSLLQAGSPTGEEARQRQLAYARELNRRVPGSHVFVIVRSAPGTRAGPALLARRSSQASEVGPNGELREGASARLSEGVEIFRTPSSAPGFVLGAYRLGRRLCRQHGIDLITSQSPFSDASVALLLRSRCKSRWIAQLHTSCLDNPYWLAESPGNVLRAWLGKFALRQADAVRTVSNAAGGWMRQALGISPERVFVIPVGSALVAQATSVSKEPVEGNMILFVGRLAIQKGVALLLHAFLRVRAECQDASLVIVGDGPERRSLEEQTSELGLQEVTRFMGMLPYEQLPGLYAQAAVVIVPSLYEPYGRVIAEAMSVGRAVIATDTEGARDLIRDGQTGLIVAVGDDQALANKMSYLLQHPQAAHRMGEAARQFIKYAHDPQALCAAQVEMWLQVAGQ